MDRVSNQHHAADRARWLAELSAALDEARGLVKQLSAGEGRAEAVELYARIEAARLEIRSIRLMRAGDRRHFDPEWSDNLPWRLTA